MMGKNGEILEVYCLRAKFIVLPKFSSELRFKPELGSVWEKFRFRFTESPELNFSLGSEFNRYIKV